MPEHVQGRKTHLLSLCVTFASSGVPKLPWTQPSPGTVRAFQKHAGAMYTVHGGVWKDLYRLSEEKETWCCWPAHTKSSSKPKTMLWGQRLLLLWAQVVARSTRATLPLWQYSVLWDCSHCVFPPLALGARAAVHIAHCSPGFTWQKITCPLFFSPSLPPISTHRAAIPSSFPFILSACRKLGTTSAPQATPAHCTRLCSDSWQRKFQFKGGGEEMKNTWQSKWD